MPINFDTIKTTRGRKYDTANIAKIDSALAYLPIQQRASIIGSIVEESGGDPHAKNETGAYQGLLQWGADRYQIQSDDPNVELDNQIQYIKETLNDTTDHKSWTDGGKGSGYNSFRDTYGAFTNPASNLEDCFRAFSFGYVRPQGKQDSFENRLKVVQQVYDRMKGDYLPLSTGHTEQPDATRVARPVLPVHRKGEGGSLDSSRQWNSLSLSEKSDIMREMVANGITNLREIRQVYNEYAEGGYMDDPEGTITENPESVEAAKSKYPFLNKLDFSVYSDPNYKASDYGYGDIEVFRKGLQKIRYTPEYTYPNPNVNQDNVLYNPNRIPGKYAQDAINLDAISHIGHNDPTYDSLNTIIGNEYPDAAIGAMVPFYKDMTGKDLMKLPYDERPAINEWVPQVLEAWDDAPHIYQNAIDGLVREYVISREHPDPKDPIYKGLNYAQYNPQWDAENNSPFYLGQMYDYITTGKRPANILPEVTVNGKKANGGHLHTFKGGGYMPSASIRRDIANWEGASMETNRSFEEEARDFNRVIPKGIRDSLTSNQLDALYSYGYNVGMGNLKKRVLPTLQAYTQGKASSQDVASSMWASRDSELRGLRRRRAWERNMFTGGRDDRHVTLESMDAPSWQDNPLFFPPNPTDYGIPVDWSSPERPMEKDYSLKDDDNDMGIFPLMESMGMLEPAQQPLATYTPQRDNSMFVISAPSSNNTMLDASWFKEGGYLYDEGGVTRASGETVYHVPSEYYNDFINGDYTVQIPEVTVSAKAPKHTGISNLVGDYLTTSNDATWFDNNRPQNPHLNDRGLRGAKMHAAWEKDNPNLAAWSMAAGAAPFAVAAYPFMAGLGEAAAGTTIGQGLTNMLNMASTTARNSTLLPWVDAGTTSYFGTQGINDISNGTFTPETAMEIAPLAQMFKPLTYSVKNVANAAWHSPYAQYPRYYLGKMYYGSDVELPTLYRKLRVMPEVNNGKIRLSPINSRLAYRTGEESPLITNMTSDVPVRSHASDWDDIDVLAFPGKTLLGKHVISTRPSDTFTYGDVLTINPNKVTYISGRPKALKIAKQRGMKTLSSEQAENVARKHAFGSGSDYRDYRVALQNLTRHNFKNPTIKDYKFMDWVFQPQYKSRVIPFQDLSNPTINQLHNSPEWVGELLGNRLSRAYLSNPKEWRNVLYHPASSVEFQFRKSKGIVFEDEL